MHTFVTFFGAIALISFLSAPAMGAGWSWDIDNGLGFAALAGMLILSMPGGAQHDVRRHEWLGYTVLAVVVVHALWFLLADGAVIEYIRPGAPAYMWTGIAGLIIFAVLIFVAAMPTRNTLHKTYTAFRYWHQFTAISGIAFVLHHIIGSGFYLRTVYQAVLLILFTLLVIFGRGVRTQSSPRLTPASFVAVSGLGAIAFAAIRNLSP